MASGSSPEPSDGFHSSWRRLPSRGKFQVACTDKVCVAPRGRKKLRTTREGWRRWCRRPQFFIDFIDTMLPDLLPSMSFFQGSGARTRFWRNCPGRGPCTDSLGLSEPVQRSRSWRFFRTFVLPLVRVLSVQTPKKASNASNFSFTKSLNSTTWHITFSHSYSSTFTSMLRAVPFRRMQPPMNSSTPTSPESSTSRRWKSMLACETSRSREDMYAFIRLSFK
mmetsp:Transcript_17640/g.48721  ORF Transcript_17640/g.48721 Transcript_17640/m.48721 type:complete len:222 (-) Transcript_17640:1077-1742(-)